MPVHVKATRPPWREETALTPIRCGFLFELHQKGVKLSQDKLDLLHKYRYLQNGEAYTQKADGARYTKRIEKAIEGSRRAAPPQEPVKTEDWMPKEDEVGNYPSDFVAWIDSINRGFNSRINYKRFDLYCLQAEQWLSEQKYFSSFDDERERRKFARQEVVRVQQNSLYYLEKYVEFKTGAMNNKYRSYEAQKIAAFLVDSGYCLLIGKGRQIFFSTTIGAIAVKRINFNKDYFVKFIAENLLKTEELFEDKVKYCFYHYPEWMKSSVGSDQEGMLRLMFKGMGNEKGTISGANSKLMVEAPYETAINGGSPDLVLLDEIGQMPIIGGIIAEGRPTLFATDPLTGKMKRLRQVVAWGCVCAGTKVWDNDGNFVNIEDVQQKNGILGYDGKQISREKITYWQKPQEKNCYRITTNTSRVLECSEDHPILWSHANFANVSRNDGRKFHKKTKFVEAKDIKVGEQVAVIDEVPVFGNKKMWEPRLIGWLIGDGTYGIDHSPRLANCDAEINLHVEKNLDAKVTKSYITKDGKIYKEIRLKGICGKLRELGIYGQTKNKKRLPVDHHSYSRQDICELLGGIFDTDGCVHYTKGSRFISLTSSCFELLNEIRFLLNKIGVHCCVRRTKANVREGSKDRNDWYVLSVADAKSVEAFHRNISFFIKYKQERLEIILEKNKGRKRKIAKDANGLRFEKVVSVEPIGMKPIYNLTANNTHTYIANGIVTHNTGGKMDAGGAELEAIYNMAVDWWNKRNFSYGFIPVFFDFWARPGMTQKHYDEEKALAYSTGKEEDKVRFHQHYPITIQDMFLSTAETVIPIGTINSALQRIYVRKEQVVKGIFQPIYDTSQKMPENSFVPYAIKGSEFIPSTLDEEAPVRMFMEPDKGWTYRYFQGTDPINTQSGYSNLSSSIWDAVLNTVPCAYNFRNSDYRQDYLQVYLMNLYFGRPIHLLENNIGGELINSIDLWGGYKQLMPSSMLPVRLQTSSETPVGIRKTGANSPWIYGYLIEMLESYKDNICIEEFFKQLKHFIKKAPSKPNSTSTKTDMVFKTSDYRYHQDDLIYGVIYAYLAADCYRHKTPHKIDEVKKKVKRKMLVCNKDTGYQTVFREIYV